MTWLQNLNLSAIEFNVYRMLFDLLIAAEVMGWRNQDNERISDFRFMLPKDQQITFTKIWTYWMSGKQSEVEKEFLQKLSVEFLRESMRRIDPGQT